MFGHLNRIKIFQKAPEKCSSVFITFKSVFEAQRAAAYLQRDDVAVFAGMTEKISVEYPTQDISRNPPVFVSTNSVGLSKKARKQMAAENKIAYCRSPEPFTVDYLKSQLAVHGPCEVYITKSDAPWTAFVVFSTPAQCAAALAAKTMGCNLPRHKRVDFQIGGHTEKELLTYLSPIGEFKNVSLEQNTCMIEFLTALGAAKAIVHTKTVPFFGQQLVADYSPSANKEGQVSEFDSVSSAADTTTPITGSLQRRQRENYLSEQFGTREIVSKSALQETSNAEPYYHRNRTMSLDALGTDLFSKFSISNLVKESDHYSLFGTQATAMFCPISPSSHPRASLSNESSITCSSPPPQLEYETKEE